MDGCKRDDQRVGAVALGQQRGDDPASRMTRREASSRGRCVLVGAKQQIVRGPLIHLSRACSMEQTACIAHPRQSAGPSRPTRPSTCVHSSRARRFGDGRARRSSESLVAGPAAPERAQQHFGKYVHCGLPGRVRRCCGTSRSLSVPSLAKPPVLRNTHHAKPSARTGKPEPNMSTIFMGRSRPDELECSETPRSAAPRRRG